MLKEVLEFILFGLPGWLAILFELSDWIRIRKNKRSDDVEKN